MLKIAIIAESDITIVAVVGNGVEVYRLRQHSPYIVAVVERSDRHERIAVSRVGHIAYLQQTAFVMLFVEVEAKLQRVQSCVHFVQHQILRN